ncbi:MAG: dTDP-4-amino-4,6-dideoxygalactose transaminase [Bacteroidota bacterium]
MINFNQPFIIGRELEYIHDAVESHKISGDGKYTQLCTGLLQEMLGSRVLLTHSCTAALEMSAMLLNISPGDEVIMPSFTFVSTANAFAVRGAKIRFCDIKPDTLNIDDRLIPALINSNTKAIVPVHYGGISCEMDQIKALADLNQIAVVEDAAQALGAMYNKKPLGTLGALGSLSFHETKNVISGEGGAIIVNDYKYYERAEIIREKGTNRSKFFRGEVDKYTWVDEGSSYLPSDIIAAYLYAQLENIDKITSKRKKIFQYYHEGLKNAEDSGKLRRPIIPQHTDPNYHLYYILLNDSGIRDKLMYYLREKNIYSVFHYLPLHQSVYAKKHGLFEGRLPATENISRRLLRLPFFYDLDEKAQEKVISTIYSFFEK